MFGLGWSEMVLVGIVALIVIGPKDLPMMFRTMGEFTGKAKRMAREFNNAMQQAADDSGIKGVKSTLEAAASPKKFGLDKIREATDFNGPKKPDTGLSPERQASKDKTDKAMADAATARQEREARIAEMQAEADDDLAEFNEAEALAGEKPE